MAAEAEGGEDRLPRKLGAWSLGFILVGIMVGSGIFRVPSTVAESVGSVPLIAGVWVVGGLLALCGALCYAELASTYPRPGGAYVYLREAWGPLPAFLYGWIRLVVAVPASLGAVALIFAGYADATMDLGGLGETEVAVVVLVVLTALNVRSVLWTALVENVTSLTKVLALAATAALIFVHGDPSAGAFSEGMTGLISMEGSRWAATGGALTAVMWSYSGWELSTQLAGEVLEPSRSIPRAFFWGVVAVIVVYLGVNAAFLYALPLAETAASSSVASAAVSAAFGPRGALLVALLVLLSTFGTLNAQVLSNARLFFAMAEDDLFFERVARVHPDYETPHVATLLVGGLGVLYVSAGNFAQLAGAFILGMWPFHMAVAAGLMRLRAVGGEPSSAGYSVPLYPLIPVVFMVVSVGMLTAVTIMDPVPSLLSLGAILAGIPVYRLTVAPAG